MTQNKKQHRRQEKLRAIFEDAARIQRAFFSDPQNIEAVDRFAQAAAETFEAGGRILACGNGGSMSDAMHFAEEWTGRFRENRAALPALALSDPSQLTCIANDFGYEEVFARQVEAHGSPRDLLVLLSTSGNSPNILRAAEVARSMELKTVGLLGRGGGKLLPLVDIPILVPDATGAERVQEVHIQVLHACLEMAENQLFPDLYDPIG